MNDKKGIFDNPKNTRRLLVGFYISLVLLLAVDLFIHKHAEFPWEDAPFFFAAYGFVSCVALIYIAKGLRMLIKRDEAYYTATADKKNAEKPRE